MTPIPRTVSPDLSIVDETQADRADIDLLEAELYQHLAEQGVPPEHRRRVVFLLRDRDGSTVGGAEGDVRWDWLKLDKMWVAAEFRGRGYGALLLGEFEAAGRRLGCRHVRTSTYSCQAPGFYRRLGYEVVAEYHDYPPGYTKMDLVKHFSDPPAGSSA